MMKTLFRAFLLLLALAPPAWAELNDFKDHTFHSAATATGDGTDLVVDKFTSIGVTVTIGGTAAEVTFKVSQDGSTFDSRSCVNTATTTGASSITASATGVYQCNIAGMQKFRVSISSCTDCTVTVTGKASTAIFGGAFSGGSANGWPVSDSNKEIEWANSEANCMKVGDGTNYGCLFWDSSEGFKVTTSPVGNLTHYIPTNQTYILRDVEGAKSFYTVDPDSIGAGSGTFTMNTSEQFVASNLGIEYTESDTNPTCAAGNYNTYADTSEAKLKSCQNGVTFDIARTALVRKTADETVDSQTRQNDDHLTFALDASSIYTLEMFVIYASTTTADYQHEFATPADAVGHFRYDRFPSNATACNTATTTAGNLILSSGSAVDNSQGGAGAATRCMIVVHGQITTTTGGTFNYKWAQTNDDGANVATVFANSYILYRKH